MNAGTLAGPLFVVLGALILRQRPRHAVGRLYLVVGVLLVAFAVANSWLVAGFPDSVRFVLGWFASWAWAVPGILVATFGMLLLPDGRLPSPRWRWVARASGLAVCGVVIGMPYDDSVSAELRTAMPEWGAPVAEVAVLVGMALALVLIPVCLMAPLVRMWRDGPRVRQQLGPVAVAGVAAIAVFAMQNVLVSLLGFDHDLVLAASVGLFPIGVTVAVLRGGLFDIHRLVSRVVAYTIVVGVLAASYLGLVLLLGAAARAVAGESSDLVVAMSTLAVAALFQPLRGRVQRVVDRRFDRARYDAARTIDAFGRSLRDQVAREAVVEALRLTAAQTFGASSVGLVVVAGEEAT